MSPALALRGLVLAAVALLAAVVALALTSRRGGSDPIRLPEPVPAPGGGWYEALAGRESPDLYGRPTTCGHVLARTSMGVAHPVLPCGAKIYLASGSKEVLTQVVSRGPTSGAYQFGLTEALARELGVRRRTTIRWRFARG